MRTAMVALAAAGLTGCVIPTDRTGPVEHFEKSIGLDKSELARVEIKMGAGELRIDGGSSNLMDAGFDYNIPSWKPRVHYDASSFRGDVIIEQPEGASRGIDSVYKWNLRLNDKLPLDVIAHLGAGEAHMNLGAVNLRSLEVHIGVGEVQVDLRGHPTHDYNVQIHGGIGEAVVHLPSDVGIVARASGGIGNIDVRGLEKHNDEWVNAAYQHSPVTIHLDIQGGIGNVTLDAE